MRERIEEIEDAGINLPKSVLWAFALNGTLAFLILVTVIFTMGDVDSLLATTTGYPFIQLFYNTVQSKAATNAMVFLIIFSLTNCAISETATASRQIWSFARDNGLPGSVWLAKVGLTLQICDERLIFGGLTAYVCTGFAWAEHPFPRGSGVSCRHEPPISDQHRLHCRSICHHFTRRSCVTD